MARMIDADGHIVEPRVLWEEYVEPEFRDRVIQIRPDREGREIFYVNGEARNPLGGSIVMSVIPGGFLDLERARNATYDDVLPGSYDPEERIRVMDVEGIELAVLYPSFWLLYGDITDARVAAAACRAYNNWMADFCRPYPARLFGVAPMPLQDVGEAIREMRRAVTELNFKAVFIRPNPFNGRRLNDPAYDPFWHEAQELGIPVAIHSSFGTRMPTLGGDRYRDPFFSHMVCHPFEQQAACMDMICGGVLERYPRLKVAFLEAGVGWIGYWLDRMDCHYIAIDVEPHVDAAEFGRVETNLEVVFIGKRLGCDLDGDAGQRHRERLRLRRPLPRRGEVRGRAGGTCRGIRLVRRRQQAEVLHRLGAGFDGIRGVAMSLRRCVDIGFRNKVAGGVLGNV